MRKKLFPIMLCFCIMLCVSKVKAQETAVDDAAISGDISGDTLEIENTTADSTAKTSEEVGQAVEEMESDEEAMALTDEDTTVTAEDLDIEEPTLLPTSGWYFAKNMWRGIKTITTFNPVKKAELKLQFANEKLFEAKKVAEETGDTAIIENALENYREEIDTVKEKIENIKENAEDNPMVDKFLDKLADHQIKQTKILEKLEGKLPEEVFAKVKEAKEKVIENLGNAISRLENRGEKITERLETVMEKQNGGEFKAFKNIEFLKKMEEQVPDSAKKAIHNAMENKIENLKEKIDEIKDDKNKMEQFKKYMGAVAGNQARHLEILNEIKNDDTISAELANTIEDIKKQPMLRLRNKLETMPTEEAREQFLNHLQNGEMEKLEVIKEIENNLPPEMQEKIKTIKETAFNAFENKMQKIISDPEKRKEFFDNMPPPPIEQMQIMDEMREFATPENMAMIQEIKEKSMDKLKEKLELMKDEPEKQQEFMNKMMGQNSKQFIEGNMNRLRAMKEMENNLPDEFKSTLKPMQAQAIEDFKKDMEKFENDPEGKEAFMEKIMRYDARQFEIMEDLEKDIDPEKKKLIEEMRDKAFMDMNKEFEKLDGDNESAKEAFLNRISGDDPQQIRVLERVREKIGNNLPNNAKAGDMLDEVMKKQIEKIEDKANFIEDPDRLEEFKKNMNSWDIKQKLRKTEYFDADNFMKGMDARIEDAKEGHEAKMEGLKMMEQKKIEEKKPRPRRDSRE